MLVGAPFSFGATISRRLNSGSLSETWSKLSATWIRITVPIPSANDRLFLGRRVTLPSHTRFGHCANPTQGA